MTKNNEITYGIHPCDISKPKSLPSFGTVWKTLLKKKHSARYVDIIWEQKIKILYCSKNVPVISWDIPIRLCVCFIATKNCMDNFVFVCEVF